MMITDDYNVSSPILEAYSYYPFGLQQKGIGLEETTSSLQNKYTYNGKELQEDLGLDQYDYGARFYDAQIGRWLTQDPLSEISQRWSTYNYAYNNPLRFIDANGMYSTSPLMGDFKNPDHCYSCDELGYWTAGGGAPTPPDWYRNDDNGDFKLFDGSGKHAGYTNIGKSRTITSKVDDNVVDTYNLNSDASVTSDGKRYTNGASIITKGGHSITTGEDQNMDNGGLSIYWPEVTANLTAAAGGAVRVNSVGIEGGVGVTLLGYKDGNFEVAGHDASNWNRGWQRRSWGTMTFLAVGAGKESVTDGNSRKVLNHTTSIPLMGAFQMDVMTNPSTGRSVTQLSLNLNWNFGLGIIVESGIKVPFYKIRE